MIFYDSEVFKYNWLVVWLDTKTKKQYYIWDDKDKLERMYNKYKNEIWVGYNSRTYDTFIIQGILCGFNPYKISSFIIQENRKGWEFSNLLRKYPILNYDCSVGFRSLKELEAFMGHDIRETEVPFDIDRPLTEDEKAMTLKYCSHDVSETFQVFMETTQEYESHIGLINEFKLPLSDISKTKAQLSAKILQATKRNWNDEFDIDFADTISLNKPEYIAIKNWFKNWSDNIKNYEITLECNVAGVTHQFAFGGLHGAIKNHIGDGIYLMCDVASYYPALMIEYGYLSRNVRHPEMFRQIRDERIIMKRNKDPRQQPRKIVINSTFGASKDKYNPLYDPKQANNVCINGQLFLLDLIEKIEPYCQLIQSNTDGILVKVTDEQYKAKVIELCNEWSKRTRFDLEFEEYSRVIQRDVNNYILVGKDGHIKSKGAVVKELSNIDNNLPIVNKAVVDYFTKGIMPEITINNCDQLIMFQQVSKISAKYDYAIHNHSIVNGKVQRCFASKNQSDTALYKKHKQKTTYDKTPSTPDCCFLDNTNILDKPIPDNLDKRWYINQAYTKISEFVG